MVPELNAERDALVAIAQHAGDVLQRLQVQELVQEEALALLTSFPEHKRIYLRARAKLEQAQKVASLDCAEEEDLEELAGLKTTFAVLREKYEVSSVYTTCVLK